MPMYFFIVFLAILNVSECGLQFLALGDWGDTSLTRQEKVAEAMDKFCEKNPCDFIVSTGDNFYNDGVTSANDPRFNTSWRFVYDGPTIAGKEWYISVGNHDHTLLTNAELYQVEFSTLEPRWKLPWLWHDDYFAIDEDTSLHLVVIDSESMWTRKHNVTAQELWLEDVVSRSLGDYLVVVAHHPLYSTGDYFGNVALRPFLDDIFLRYDVDVYLTGHDHNLQSNKGIGYIYFAILLQHIVPLNATDFPTDHVTSGGGGRRPYSFSNVNNQLINNAGYESKYFGELNGFTVFDFDNREITISHVTYTNDEEEEAIPVQVYQTKRPRRRREIKKNANILGA